MCGYMAIPEDGCTCSIILLIRSLILEGVLISVHFAIEITYFVSGGTLNLKTINYGVVRES